MKIALDIGAVYPVRAYENDAGLICSAGRKRSFYPETARFLIPGFMLNCRKGLMADWKAKAA